MMRILQFPSTLALATCALAFALILFCFSVVGILAGLFKEMIKYRSRSFSPTFSAHVYNVRGVCPDEDVTFIELPFSSDDTEQEMVYASKDEEEEMAIIDDH